MITLCIPTKDRSEFLSRLLRYYVDTGYRHTIAIGDSSEGEPLERNQRMVSSLSGHLKITHHTYPGLSSCAVLEQLSQRIETPYCAFIADDDFLCTKGMERCVEFLEGHPEYGAAHGKGLLLLTEGGSPYGTIGQLRPYPQAVLRADTGSARLIEFFTSSLCAVLYSVHRRDTWRAMFRGLGMLSGTMNQNIFKDELIPTSVSVIRGRIKELDSLYLVRQMHERIRRHPHVYEWITASEWFPSFQRFQDRIVEELVQEDGVSAQEARVVLKQAFWPYLAHEVTSAWNKQQAKVVHPSRLREQLKRIPGLRKGWRSLDAFVQRHRASWSLPALLEPSSLYHADFLPIYELITRGSAEVPPHQCEAVAVDPALVESNG